MTRVWVDTAALRRCQTTGADEPVIVSESNGRCEWHRVITLCLGVRVIQSVDLRTVPSVWIEVDDG